MRGSLEPPALVVTIEPIPAAGLIGAGILAGIDDVGPFGLREFVHARPQGKIVGPLGAAVQHHEQRTLARSTARHEQPVAACARRAGISPGFEKCTLRNPELRRRPGRHFRQGTALAQQVDRLTERKNQAIRAPALRPGEFGLQ